MKLNSTARTLESTLDTPVADFKIAASAKAFQILSSSIYTKKEEAIVRELLANAADAHVAAGRATRPIDLHLPTELEPWLTFTDYGTGLSDEAIHELYTTYFGSDKTGTNDLIGGFGLGSKSPLCYTDQFSVTSRYNGRAMEWSIYVGQAGVPCVTKTSEQDYAGTPGLTVHMAIDPSDAPAFRRAAMNLIPYFKVPITCNQELKYDRKVLATFTTPHGDVLITKDAPYKQAVVQGSIPYELDMSFAWENLYYHQRGDNVAHILRNWEFEIHVPIGTYEIATSRESLAYDKRTKEALTVLFNAIAGHIVDDFETQVTSAETYARALTLYHSMYNNTHALRRALKKSGANGSWLKNPTWNDQSLESVSKPTTFSVNEINETYTNKQRVKRVLRANTSVDTIHGSQMARILGDALPIYWQPKQRPFQKFFETQGSTPALLLIGDETDVRSWVEDLYGANAPEIEEVPLIKRTTTKQSRTGTSASTAYATKVYTTSGSAEHSYTLDDLIDAMQEPETAVLLGGHNPMQLLINVEHGLASHTPYTKILVPNIYPSHKKVRETLIEEGAYTGYSKLTEAYEYDLAKIRELIALRDFDEASMAKTIRDTSIESYGFHLATSRDTGVESDFLDKVWWVQKFHDYLRTVRNGALATLNVLPPSIVEAAGKLPLVDRITPAAMGWYRTVDELKATALTLDLSLIEISGLLQHAYYDGPEDGKLRQQAILLNKAIANNGD